MEDDPSLRGTFTIRSVAVSPELPAGRVDGENPPEPRPSVRRRTPSRNARDGRVHPAAVAGGPHASRGAPSTPESRPSHARPTGLRSGAYGGRAVALRDAHPPGPTA